MVSEEGFTIVRTFVYVIFGWFSECREVNLGSIYAIPLKILTLTRKTTNWFHHNHNLSDCVGVVSAVAGQSVLLPQHVFHFEFADKAVLSKFYFFCTCNWVNLSSERKVQTGMLSSLLCLGVPAVFFVSFFCRLKHQRTLNEWWHNIVMELAPVTSLCKWHNNHC